MLKKSLSLSRWEKQYAILILAIGGLLRLFLGLVNRQANDNHTEVIDRLIHHLPVDLPDCWQCYHPHLYHQLVAWIAGLTAMTNQTQIIIIGQLINVAAGCLTLGLIWYLIRSFRVASSLRLVTLLLVALNPDLLAINSQATNDSLVILLGTATFVLLVQFLARPNFVLGITVWIIAGLAALTKASGLICLFLVFLTFIIKLTIHRKERSVGTIYALTGLTGSLVVIVMLALWSPYYHYSVDYHSPFISNATQSSPPPFFRPDPDRLHRPGVESVVDGYLTFHFVSLLKQPFITNGQAPVPPHRTSLWTQLYGRAHSIHFAQWPTTWQNQSRSLINLTRALFIVALVPTVITFLGYIWSIIDTVQKIWQQGVTYLTRTTTWLWPLTFSLFLLLLIKFTATYRDFSAMKLIYIYPIVAALPLFFIQGVDWMNQQWPKRSVSLWRIVLICSGCLAILYFVDITWLIYQLAH